MRRFNNARLFAALCAMGAISTLVLSFATHAANADDDKLKKLIKSRGLATIKIVEAKVPDMDPFPAQGDSDVFYRVALVTPLAVSGNTSMCVSTPVQDSNKPKHDFECPTKQAVPGDSNFLIEVLDSDKPDTNADVIGVVNISLSDIIFNQSLDTERTYAIKGQDYPKYYVKAKVSYKPTDK